MYNVHGQLYDHVLQFHGNQHKINNNNMLHSLMMVQGCTLSVDNTLHTILTVHTSVVPVTSYDPDYNHL